jgi:hypothetical protein
LDVDRLLVDRLLVDRLLVDRLLGCNIKPGMYLWIDYLVVILNQGCTCG